MASAATTAGPIIACLDASAVAPRIVRAAKALADLTHASWQAVHVATPLQAHWPRAAAELLLGAFRMAEEMGATTHQLNGDDPASEILAYAQDQHASHLVVGAPSRPPWIEAFSPSVLRRLLSGAGDIAIEVCPQDVGATRAQIAHGLRAPGFGDLPAYLITTAFVVVASLLAVPVDRALALPNISLVYVLVVIGAAIRYGAIVAAFTALLSALAYNFFLTEPYYSFQISDPSNVWAVFFFLAIGLIVSAVAAHTRAQTHIARRQAAQANALQALAHTLAETDDARLIGAATVQTTSKLLFARAVVLVARQGALELVAEEPGPEMLGADDLSAARWAFEHRSEAGHGSTAFDGARWLFAPLPGERGPVGVLGARPFDDPLRLDPEQRRLMDVLAVQAGLALDRTRLGRAAADARVEAESERLKGAVLSSLSHDLRTPLATIRASIESVLRYEDRHDPATKRELLENAAGEAQKLSRFIQNLLDMARLDAGSVRVKCEPTDVADLIEDAIQNSHPPAAQHIARDIATGLPIVSLDRALTQSAVIVLLENASKFSSANSTILVRARRDDDAVVVEVLDEGPGFPEHVLAHVFEKSVRGVEGDGRAAGTGLGLAIAKGFVTAQGGSIEAQNRPDRSGACVRMRFPIGQT